jgi:sulfotransferase family protein
VKRAVFIASRGHSGSTLLDLMLGGRPPLVGVGEVFSMFTPKLRGRLRNTHETICSCGRPGDECEFWGPASARLDEVMQRGGSAQEFYGVFLDSFYEHFGSDSIPVDISKTNEALQVLLSVPGVDVRVIFLIRDVRSWTVSMRDVNRRAGDFYIGDLVRKYGWRAWKPYLGRTAVKYFWHWYLINRQTQRYLHKKNIQTIQIGYEELCLYPDLALRKICDFLGVGFEENGILLGDGSNHVLHGNRMRAEPDKRQRVAYDDRWFYSGEWQLPSILFPHIMKYNNLEVYKNVRGYLWK